MKATIAHVAPDAAIVTVGAKSYRVERSFVQGGLQVFSFEEAFWHDFGRETDLVRRVRASFAARDKARSAA